MTKEQNFLLETLKSCFEFMSEPLRNHEQFSESLSHKLQVKEGGNIQYSFDVELDQLIKDKITNAKMGGRIYSEESGFFDVPGESYRIVYDPFCNSSLASRGFREAAAGISVFDHDYQLISAAILDYQTGLVAMSDGAKTSFYQVQNGHELSLERQETTSLEDSWIVLTVESRSERAHLAKAEGVLSKAKRLITSSGHIYWLKLATGQIDAYTDPFGGEKLYEMFAAVVAQTAGAIITDLNGEAFNAGEYLKKFEQDTDLIYYPVGATNATLHQQLLATLAH